ncbi:aldolase/citrate lyase family protein, partial [Rhizobium ruizarguesonis]
ENTIDAVGGGDVIECGQPGPADLAADMGHLGRPGDAEVQQAVEAALIRIQSHGKAAGILTADQSLDNRYVELGATFVAIGNDVGLLANGASRQLSDFRNAGATTAGS